MRCWWNGALPAPGIRTIRDMRSVLAAPSCRVTDPLYYMYRDLARLEATPVDAYVDLYVI